MNLRFEEEAKKEKRKNLVKELIRYVIEVIFVITLAYLIVNFALKKLTVIGSAMENTMLSGQDVIANTLIYKIVSPSRGAIIAFYPEKAAGTADNINDSSILIRRIVGLPGEKIRIENGKVYANGEEIEEKYNFNRTVSAGRAEDEIELEEDEYFVLSDKRTDLDDSRSASFTKVRRDNIIGVVFMSTEPLSLISGPKDEKEDMNTEEEQE